MNLTAMAKADTVSINKGEIQAIVGNVAYIGFILAANRISCSVDAKSFVAAIKQLSLPMFTERESELVIFDEEQQIILYKKNGNAQIAVPKDVAWRMYDTAPYWTSVEKFVDSQFPGIKLTENYLEVLSEKLIVRVQLPFGTCSDDLIFSQTKINKLSDCFCIADNKLWIKYPEDNYIVINNLPDVVFPDTSSYFDSSVYINYEEIPSYLADMLVPCDKVEFKENQLLLSSKDILQAPIDDIEGIGVYEYKWFSKIVANATHWYMDDNVMYFYNKDTNLYGVLENEQNV